MGVLKGLALAFSYFVGLGVSLFLGVDPTSTTEILWISIPTGMMKEFTIGYVAAIPAGLIPWGM